MRQKFDVTFEFDTLGDPQLDAAVSASIFYSLWHMLMNQGLPPTHKFQEFLKSDPVAVELNVTGSIYRTEKTTPDYIH